MNKNKITKKYWITISIVFFILAVILVLVAFYVLADFYPNTFSKPRWIESIIKKTNLDSKVSNIFKADEQSEKNNSCSDCLRRSIDGIFVKRGEENLYPIAVIIENHVDARPSSGLAQANLIFEAEAEGGITRYFAIFAAGQDVREIGPIRSVRPYFIDWARELSGLLVHCGGSPEALVKITKDNIISLNEFYNSEYYWRSETKPGPHNIYTSTDNLYNYLESEDLEEGKYLSWQYKDEQPLAENAEGTNIKIKFISASYIVDWVYDKGNNDYIRYLAGEKHKDTQGEEIRAKNIAIAVIPAEVIDEELRLKMQHIGEGEAFVCRDGKCEEGKWQKKSSSARTRFYEENGDEFKFNAGTTWVEVIRPEVEIEYN